jgi:YfiR/HmsC-like
VSSRCDRSVARCRRRWQTSVAAVLVCFIAELAAVHPISGQDNVSAEYQIKAAFLFHFAQFVEWPDEVFKDANSPITYCTIGEDPFRGGLEEMLRGKTIAARRIRVDHLKQVDAIPHCQVLFIGAAENKRATEILASAKTGAVLTVGESTKFVADGGMIAFTVEGNKVRFEINLTAVNAAKLRMSARLLSLAKSVTGSGGGN